MPWLSLLFPHAWRPVPSYTILVAPVMLPVTKPLESNSRNCINSKWSGVVLHHGTGREGVPRKCKTACSCSWSGICWCFRSLFVHYSRASHRFRPCRTVPSSSYFLEQRASRPLSLVMCRVPPFVLLAAARFGCLTLARQHR